MDIFGVFPNEDVQVEKKNGLVVGPYKAIFTGKSIIIPDEKADIEEGDIIIRRLPSGKDERSVVTEATFFQTMHGVPAHYQIKFKKGSADKMSGKVSHNITIHEAQSVQIGDFNTQNVINSFHSLINQIESSSAPQQQKDEAKSLLANFLRHPLVSSILGAAAGAILG